MPRNAFRQALQRIFLHIPEPGLIVAALSGGVDSVVLTRLLAECRPELPGGTRIMAAHLNHGLRGEDADADMEFCRALAVSLNIEFAATHANARETALREGVGEEEAGRMLRYRFFRSLVNDGGLVLTGHHAGDQAETILMHLHRGAHRRGLSGMRELGLVRVPPGITTPVARPLLQVTRDDIRKLAASEKWEWREDATNADTGYARNRIRHRIIPALEALMPGFRVRLLEKAAAVAGEENVLVERARALVERVCRREHGGRFFRIDEESQSEPERLLYAFRQVVEDELGARLPYGAVLSRLAELAATGRLGETLSLPGMLRVRRESDGLFFFFPGRDGPDEYGEFILPDPPFSVRAYGLTVSADWRPAAMMTAEDMADPEVQWLDATALRLPLRLRTPHPGERFRPLGAPGSRKIQDILVDCKCPRRQRDLPRLLADHAGGVWLWPLRLAHRVRLHEKSARALRVVMRETRMEGEDFIN